MKLQVGKWYAVVGDNTKNPRKSWHATVEVSPYVRIGDRLYPGKRYPLIKTRNNGRCAGYAVTDALKWDRADLRGGKP